MHFACQVFANEYIRRLVRCTIRILSPVRKNIGQDEVLAKTVEGTLSLALANCAREWNKTLVDIAMVMTDPGVLVDLAFGVDPEETNAQADDTLLAEKMFWLTLNLLGAYLSWLPLRSDTLPWMFSALPHPDASVRQGTLARLQRLWGLLNLYEERRGEEQVASLLEGMIWPAMPWVRESLLELDETDFQAVPGRLREALSEFSMGWSNTHLSEQVFQNLRGHEVRGDTAGKLGPKKAWSFATSSGLLNEWGRRQVESSPEHRSTAFRQNFPQSAFCSSAEDLTLDPKMFAELCSDQWTSPGPLTYPYTIWCTLAMEACGEDTDRLSHCCRVCSS